MKMISTVAKCLFPLCSTAAYTIDKTMTQVIPGLVIDMLATFQTPPSPKTYENFKVWGKEKGCTSLQNLSKLQQKRWFLYPLEYCNSSSILSGRRTYYSAAIQKGYIDSIDKVCSEVEALAKKHFKDKNSVRLNTLESNTKQALQRSYQTPSFSQLAWNPYRLYPNTPLKHYTAWALRWGAFYGLSPFSDRTLSIVFAAACVYSLTILLNKGVRSELASLRSPATNGKKPLSPEVQEVILETASKVFGKSDPSFKEELEKLKIDNSPEDPFKAQNKENLPQQFADFQQLRDQEEAGSSKWYQYDFQMFTTQIHLHASMHIRGKSRVESQRKEKWKEWYRKYPEQAVAFLKNDAGFSDDKIASWQPAQGIEHISTDE